MLFPGLLVLTSNLCSGGCWDLHIAWPNTRPKLRVTGRAGMRLTNRSPSLTVVLQPLTNPPLRTLEAKCDFSMKVKQFVWGLGSN